MSYDYKVLEVLRVVDGDTIDLKIDLGFHLHSALRFRLLGVDTPERGQPGWSEATLYVVEWLNTHHDLRVETTKSDNFGRWLGTVYDLTTKEYLNALIIINGFGVPYSR